MAQFVVFCLVRGVFANVILGEDLDLILFLLPWKSRCFLRLRAKNRLFSHQSAFFP
jgi:hypothetical protein